jgi:tetratricopeptide (TPR) repeat protein
MKASKTVRYLCHGALALGSAFAAAMPARSQGVIPGYPNSVRAYDRREVALLPRYCIYTQDFRERVPGGNNPDQIKRWYSKMGDTFHAMHHYCWGLMKTNRAILLVGTEQLRNFYLKDAIGEYDFVIRNATKEFALLPEILTKKGENLIRLGTASSGILELQYAIRLKPDYWPPYVQLSDYYKGTGNFQKAREYLEKGLSYSPDVKDLKMRLTELEGVNAKRKAAPQSIEKSTKPRQATPGRPAQELQPAKARPAEPPAPAVQ